MNDFYHAQPLGCGQILPEGWMKEQLHRDLTEGYIGKYDEFCPTVQRNVFVTREMRSRKRLSLKREWWYGEHEGYLKDAVIRMAFLTGNEEYIKKAESWMEELRKATKEDGYLGIYKAGEGSGSRFQHKCGNGELWTTSRILIAVLAYYQFTGDDRFLGMAEDAVGLIITHYNWESYFSVKAKDGGISHGIGLFEVLEWLYRITGNQIFLDFSLKLYRDFNSGVVRDDDLRTAHLSNRKRLFRMHGAHIAEGIFVPQFINAQVHSPDLNRAARFTIEKLIEHLTPGGAMRCDEWIKGRRGTADERYEYCGITEMINPLACVIALTGRMELADLMETMVFNAAQAGRFPVLQALAYFSKDNRIKINNYEIIKRESYDSAHMGAVCCALNGGRLLPYFIQNMWMKKSDGNGVMALLYGPNILNTEISGQRVEIREETDYPFSDSVTFTIKPEKSIKFDITIRLPHGCHAAEVQGSSRIKVSRNTDSLTLHCRWRRDQKVTILFSFKVRKISQPSSQTVNSSGLYLKRGPLVYALPFEHQKKPVKEHGGSGFFRYKLKTKDTTGWDLMLDPEDEFTFTPVKNKDILHPWDAAVVSLRGPLTDEEGNKVESKLVPMGNTVFRRVTFTNTIMEGI